MRIDKTIALVTGAKLPARVRVRTGGNRGIGAALVQALLEQGASNVYAAARQETDLAALRAKNDRRIIPVQLDVTDAAQVDRVAAQASDLGLLFDNAGVLNFGSVLDAPSTAFDRNFDVNVFGLLNNPSVRAGAHHTSGRRREHPDACGAGQHAEPWRVQRVESGGSRSTFAAV